MENIDPALASRVWQRVQAGPDPAPEAPASLLLEAQADAAVFAALSRRLRGPAAELARQLAREEQSQADTLRGICLFAAEKSPGTASPAPAPGPVRSALRRCYGSHLRRLGEYEARSGDAAFGAVYQTLAHRERHHCAKILELLALTPI